MLSLEVLMGYSVFGISFLLFLILVFANLSRLITDHKKIELEEKQIQKIEGKLGLNKPIVKKEIAIAKKNSPKVDVKKPKLK